MHSENYFVVSYRGIKKVRKEQRFKRNSFRSLSKTTWIGSQNRGYLLSKCIVQFSWHNFTKIWINDID